MEVEMKNSPTKNVEKCKEDSGAVNDCVAKTEGCQQEDVKSSMEGTSNAEKKEDSLVDAPEETPQTEGTISLEESKEKYDTSLSNDAQKSSDSSSENKTEETEKDTSTTVVQISDQIESSSSNKNPEDSKMETILEETDAEKSKITCGESKSENLEKSSISVVADSPAVEELQNPRDPENDENEDNDENGHEEEEDGIREEIVVEHEDSSVNVEQPEVGIVGLPTAVTDLLNEEELGTTESSSPPSDTRNNEINSTSNNNSSSNNNNGNRAPDVAEWIERSRLTNDIKINEASSNLTQRRRKKSSNDPTNSSNSGTTRNSQKIVTSIIRKSIKCLNKMHAAAEYGNVGTATMKKMESCEKQEEDSRSSPKVPQNRQNGAALPEETAATIASKQESVNTSRVRTTVVKDENYSETEEAEEKISAKRVSRRSVDEVPADSRNSRRKSPVGASRNIKSERENTRKRRSTDDTLASSCGQFSKKMCFEQRERFIDSLVGTSERVSADELATRAEQLRAEVQALDELARAKELEWNEILSMRKLKEEAYLRIERRRQVVGYMESNGQLQENLPPASLSLTPEWESPAAGTTGSGCVNTAKMSSQESSRDAKDRDSDETRLVEIQDSQRLEEASREASPVATKRERASAMIKAGSNAQRRTASPKQLSENGRKQQQQRNQQQQHRQQQQQSSELQMLDNRQIGEGRQGPIVDVRSIIADYRLRHPETVPRRYDNKKETTARDTTTRTQTATTNTRSTGLINVRRGRRMRNSANIGLATGSGIVETSGHHHHNVDSRPSSTDSCKSSSERNATDSNNPMSFKDVLVQFAKLSQQQGEPVKTPQNYPDVTLHPVAPTTVTINSTPQQTTGSLLHGILTKSQSPRPTTFSPTLARLLTAPERERTNLPTSITAVPQQNIQTQHLLQTYQGSNPVSISDLLSSSKARTEITITPVVTPITPSHTSQTNNLVHVDDVEEDTSLIDERDSRLGSGGRDNRDERDSPPRCQGCQERAAQFVCAGCGNQWYCSRDCQVAAWDEHSEVCSG